MVETLWREFQDDRMCVYVSAHIWNGFVDFFVQLPSPPKEEEEKKTWKNRKINVKDFKYSFIPLESWPKYFVRKWYALSTDIKRNSKKKTNRKT